MSGGYNRLTDVIADVEQEIGRGASADLAIVTVAQRRSIQYATVLRYWQRRKEFEGVAGKSEQMSAPIAPPPPTTRATAPVVSKPDIAAALLTAVKARKRSVTELADMFSVPPKEIQAALEHLKSTHVLIDASADGYISLERDIPLQANPYSIDLAKHGETWMQFGFVTDTHIGSKYERLDVLHTIYDIFESEGITDVYHGGNWIDGEARFNKFDLYVHGIGSQTKNFIEKYPRRPGITTHILSGDDHEGWYVQREGVNVGAFMEYEARKAGREDLIDLGYMERDIELKQPDGSATMRIVHPGGGSAYATSYTEQKYVESLQGGEKPQVILFGHYHKFNQGYPREIRTVQGGCCQDQTPFMRKHKIQAHLGGCIIHMLQAGNGVITRFRAEWIPFYDKKFYAYKW